MFNAKQKSTGEILQVLSVFTPPELDVTYFFVWENNGWRWRPANSFVPPNYEIEKETE